MRTSVGRSSTIPFAPLALVLLFPVIASAQQYSNHEVTVGVQSQTWGQQTDNGFDHNLQYPTPSFTYTRNLSSTLAVEGTVEPWTQFFHTNYLESGHETLALGGIKAGWRGKEWGFYGKTQAGIASWSCGTWYYNPQPYSDCSRLTNFTLEYGGVIERRLSKHYSLRFDAAHLLSTEFDETLARYPSGLPAMYRAGGTLQHLDIRLGLTRSFGAIHDASGERIPVRAAWDIGAVFALQPRAEPVPGMLNAYPGPGIWASWNFSQHFSWDIVLIHSGAGRLGQVNFANTQSGGRALEALTGLKMGLRRDRMGYFGKVRGGTITFGETERQIGFLPDGSSFIVRGMFTNPVLDVGAVWEVYPSRHSILRFDAGSATIFYQPKDVWQWVPNNGLEVGTKYAVPGETQTGLLLSFGGGFRF
jgi:hypothetical protein